MAGLALIPGGGASCEAAVDGVERAPVSIPCYSLLLWRQTHSSCSSSQRGRDGHGTGPATELDAKIKHTHELDVVPEGARITSVEVLKEAVSAATHSEDESPAAAAKDGRPEPGEASRLDGRRRGSELPLVMPR